MRRFNDRTAKRLGKAEFVTNIVSKELYEIWRNEHPEYKKLSYQDFNKLWNTISKQIREHVSDNPMGIKLPFHCGDIRVQYLPKKIFSPIDVATSNELGEKVPHLNITTKGKIAKISWIRKLAARFNPHIILFGFEQTRELGRNINEVILQKPEIFRNSNFTLNDNKQRDNI